MAFSDRGVAAHNKTKIPSAASLATSENAQTAYAEGICVQNNPNAYNGYNLKDRIFKDTDGRAEWRAKRSAESGEAESFPLEKENHPQKKKAELNAKYEAQRKEQKGKHDGLAAEVKSTGARSRRRHLAGEIVGIRD